jgi:DNA-binding beta-propeller fold protein YncE
MRRSNGHLSPFLLISPASARQRPGAARLVVLMLWILAPAMAKAATQGTSEATYNFHSNGLLADPGRPYVYATTGSELDVINTNTLAIAASVSLPGAANGIAIASNDNTLYIGGANGVYVVNAQTDSLLTTLNLGYSVSQVAVGKNNRLYVLSGSQIAQIDATSGASVGPSMPVSIYSGGIQISPDGSTLYYANYGISPGSLYKINVSTTTPSVVWTNSTDIGENGRDLVLSNDGSMLSYVCGYGDGGYQIPNFQTSNMSLLGLFNTGAYPEALAYSPDGGLAYALAETEGLFVFSTKTYQLLGEFGVGDSVMMATDESGRDLFVANSEVFPGESNNTAVYATGVPEPSTVAILAAGALGLAACAWRKRRLAVQRLLAHSPPASYDGE